MLGLGRLGPILAAGAIAACCAATAAAATTPVCKNQNGRYLLQCGEKQEMLPDSITWGHEYVLDFEMFEAKTSLPLYNRALNQFWHFEAATAAARGELELEIGAELTDQNFETLATAPKLPTPSVRPYKVVNRKLARSLSRLMAAEQREVVNLEALATALNRATFARYSAARQDWMRWQLASAAGFARQVAASIPGVIRAQKAAASGLIAKKLLFGVGTTDLKLAQRRVRKYGLARGLKLAMQRIALSAPLIANITRGFTTIRPTSISFSLSALLAAPKGILREQQFAAGLRHFAARIPSAGRPPS